MVYPSDGFSAAATLEAITDYKCTSVYGVPTMVKIKNNTLVYRLFK